jgi:hypothetical protein
MWQWGRGRRSASSNSSGNRQATPYLMRRIRKTLAACALCSETRELQDSHVIPRGCYNRLRGLSCKHCALPILE